jgi:SagB-type dehydrogenase family enzyme
MRLVPKPASAADEFHLASANVGPARSPRAHEINYSPQVAELVRGAPLALESAARVALPRPDGPLGVDLAEAIVRRKSGRRFGPDPLPAGSLARLLYLANAVRHPERGPDAVADRNAPSGGGLGSVEIFCFALGVEGVEPGLYHFDTVRHDLALRRRGHFGTWLATLAFSQVEWSEAGAVLVLTCAMGRLAEKYGLRGYRLGLLDAGHVSQNLQLVATALGLEACAISGFVDEELNRGLELDGLDRCAVLGVAIGTPGLTGPRAGATPA